VHETPADLAALQDLLDRSYATAGHHLLSIITPDRRLSAEQLADRLTGMCLLALATVTADGRPIVGPVDGIFFRGAFHFGSSPDSVRFVTSEIDRTSARLTCRARSSRSLSTVAQFSSTSVATQLRSSGKPCWRSTFHATDRSGRTFSIREHSTPASTPIGCSPCPCHPAATEHEPAASQHGVIARLT
jgi:hypothetical protein